jgi:hypothetical protein
VAACLHFLFSRTNPAPADRFFKGLAGDFGLSPTSPVGIQAVRHRQRKGATETGRKLREFDAQQSKFANELANSATAASATGTDLRFRKPLN